MSSSYIKVYNSQPFIFERIQEGVKRSKHERMVNPSAPTPYTNLLGVMLKSRWPGDMALNTHPAVGAVYPENCRVVADPAYNRAYDKFKGQIQESAMALVNLAEGRQSLSMIEKRVMQLIQLAQAVKRFDAAAIYRNLQAQARRDHAAGILSNASLRGKSRIAERTRHHRLTGKASDLWLELHFGWAPLVSDLHTVANLFTRGTPNRVTATAQGQGDWVEKVPDGLRVSGSISIAFKIGAKVSVRNQHLHTAEAAGLLNPLSVAWELVPFSFVVDWFTDAGAVLASASDFAGLELSEAYVTQHRVCTATEWLRDWDRDSQTWVMTHPKTILAVRTQRSLGIESPRLLLRSFPDVFKSVVRAATAVSLLVQELRRLDDWTHFTWQKR